MTGELMFAARPFMEMNLHPTVVVSAYYKALDFAKSVLNSIAKPIDTSRDEEVLLALQSCIGTKFASRWGKMISNLTIKATKIILREGTKNKLNLEIKRYARIEKIPGGTLDDSEVLDGVMVNKDITHPKMRRQIRNPRIILLDCPLEYKKGESQTNMELKDENAMCDALEQEMQEIAFMCNDILKWKPDIVIT
jgi:T-complex protein 1 subunit gamma